MRSITAPRPRPKGPGLVTALIVLLVVLAIGGWALMIVLGIVGAAVGFWPSVGAFALLRLIILPVNREAQS